MIKKTICIIVLALHMIPLSARHHDKKSLRLSKVEQRVSTDILNQLLANEFVLMMQTLHYHWNLLGDEFHDYHLLFDKQYNQLFTDIDLIAERIRAVGGKALGSLYDMTQYASLKEDRKKTPEPKKMVHNLVKQYEYHTSDIRNGIKKLDDQTQDYGSKKMLEDLLEQHEKTAWMLRLLTGKQ